MEQFKAVLGTLAPISVVGIIIFAVAAAVTWWAAKQVGAGRESIRTLRTALERDPSPIQLSEAMRKWPKAAEFPEKFQVNELKKLAHGDEAKWAARFEQTKALCRTFVIFAVVCLAIYILSQVFHK